MKLGIIGLGETGMQVISRLLRRTCHDLYVYDPDAIPCEKAVNMCDTAAQVCDACGIVFLTLKSESDLLALLNGVCEFLHPGSIVIDLTPISPAQAHKNANAFRRVLVDYLDCGIFSPAALLKEPFTFFVGGNGDAFTRVYPLLRCIAPDCRHMGPAGRGQCSRILCLSLVSALKTEIENSINLADSIGISREYFLDSIHLVKAIARPLSLINSSNFAFTDEELAQAQRITREMDLRIQKHIEKL